MIVSLMNKNKNTITNCIKHNYILYKKIFFSKKNCNTLFPQLRLKIFINFFKHFIIYHNILNNQ